MVSLTKAFRKRSQWWLPSDPTSVCDGLLEYDPARGLDLALSGDLAPSDADVFAPLASIPVLHGRSRRGKAYTLFDAHQIHRSSPEPGFATTRFVSHELLVGAHYFDRASAQIPSLIMTIKGLRRWYYTTPVSVERTGRTAEVRAEVPEPIRVEVDGKGFSLVFHHQVWPRVSAGSIVVARKLGLEIIPRTEQQLDWFYETARKLQDFFSFCVGIPLPIGMMASWIPPSDGADEGDERQLHILRSWRQRDMTASQLRHPPTLSFTAISQSLPRLLATWFDLYAAAPLSFAILFSLMQKRKIHLENDFLALVRCLECYARNQRRLRGKLPAVLSNFLDPLPDQALRHLLPRRSDKTVLVDSRNYHAHYDMDKHDRALQGEGLFVAIVRLKALFMINLLLDLGYSPDKAWNTFSSAGVSQDLIGTQPTPLSEFL